MRNLIIAVIIIAVVATGSWFAYQATAQEKEPPPPDYETYEVGRGDISATISATGSIEPTNAVELAFRGAGRVQEILVQVGENVEEGQVLARLENDDLMLAVEQAKVGLRLAQANLDKAQTPAEAADIAAAEAGVESARAALVAARSGYQDLLRGPTAAQRRVAEANAERTRVILEQAQSAYDKIAHLPNAGLLPQAIQLQQATIDHEVAKANIETTLAPPTEGQKASALAQIAQAEAAVTQAEASLNRLRQGLSSADLAILEAQVDQAQIGVRQADLALSNTELVAPIPGTVGAINARVGELPNLGRPAVILTDSGGFNIELNVDEIDIAQVELGQTALINVDALEGLELTGFVREIAPIADAGVGSLGTGGGIVTYLVTVDLDETSAPLRAGLTAAVSIVTNEARDVIVIPNRVMRIDRQTGQAYVEKVVDGIPERVDVAVGLRNEQWSQILSGLAEGDVLAIRRADTGELIRQQFMGG